MQAVRMNIESFDGYCSRTARLFCLFKSWFPYFVYLQMTGCVQARKYPPPPPNISKYSSLQTNFIYHFPKRHLFSVICMEMQCRLPLKTLSVVGIITTL